MSADPHVPATVIYRRLLTYATPYWRIFLLAFVAMILFAGTDASVALIMKNLVDVNIVAKDPQRILEAPLLLLLLFFIRAVTGFISGSSMAWIGRMVVFKLREQMFAQLLRLPSSYFEREPSGAVLSRVTYNTEQVSQAVTTAITIMIRDTLTVIGLLAVLFYLQGMLTLIFLIVGPLIAYIVQLLSKRFRKISRRIQDSMGEVTSSVQEAIEGNRVIKIYAGQEKESAHFNKINDKNCKQNIKMQTTANAGAPLVQFIIGIVVSLIIYILIYKGVTPGEFVAYVIALLQLLMPMKHLTTISATIQRAVAAGDSIFQFIDQKPEQDLGTYQVSRVKGHVEYAQLGFGYRADTNTVLKDISFSVEPGKTLAIVGKSGSGKSTLVNLLPRFYESSAGSIKIDGVDIREFSLQALREQIAFVSQHIVLFDDTIANNIAYGALAKYDRNAIIQAAEAAHAMEFIATLEKGLDTPVGEGGFLLSGGQRQRLAIARAILKNAPILILDEATSALDSESEALVQDGIKRLCANRTTLVIAHRLSTIEAADNIIVLESGSIVESGKHAELIKRNGFYANYYKTQLEGRGSVE